MYVVHVSFFVCNSISVTVGPPKNISVTPGKGSLIIHFSPPFDVTTEVTFEYHVHYWEKTGTQQARTFLLCLGFLFFGVSDSEEKPGPPVSPGA